MEERISKSFQKLKHYCEKQEFKGWDPYDGLSSRLFKALPIIRNNRFCRLAWIQLFKRSPINFRSITGVKKEFNTKGIGLFLTGYCNLYSREKKNEYLDKINFFAEKIIELQSKGYSGSCWGYNFDWQARAFFQPKHTPTVVATSFVADSLFNAYEITNNKKYLDTALSSADFVLKDLNRTYDEKGNFSFSYSPLDKTQVFNASLLGARLLSRCFFYTKNEIYKIEAQKAVAFVCDRQQSNGAWAYGTLPFHQWIDNFHTGFDLECINDYKKYASDSSFDLYLQKGIDFYLATFFTKEGAGKYYHDKLYPIDIHSPAQLIVTLSKLGLFQQQADLAKRVMNWTIENMQDKDGYFYYQKKKYFSSHIPYMRWAQAWMFYAMSYYLKEVENK
jgi:rhamnogalacturonyl hydrolase YesR